MPDPVLCMSKADCGHGAHEMDRQTLDLIVPFPIKSAASLIVM